MKRLNFIFILFLISSLVFSQTPNYKFTHYTTSDGLLSNLVSCFHKDSKGFLWVGTKFGLNKFDGYKFIPYTYSRSDTNSLSSNYVKAICEDGSGKLWIGTEKGLSVFDRENELFFRYPLLDKKSGKSNDITKLFLDSRKCIWIGTKRGGLFLYKNSTFLHLSYSASNPKSICDNEINGIYELADGFIYVTTATGISVINPNDLSSTNYKIAKAPDASLAIICSAICKDLLWLGTSNGLYCFDMTKKTFTAYNSAFVNSKISIDRIINILVVDNRELWIGSNRNIKILDLSNNHAEVLSSDPNKIDGLNDPLIRALYQDDRGIIWIGTIDGGINKLNSSQEVFKKIGKELPSKPGLSKEAVFSLDEDADNNIWIGTTNGLNQFVPKSGKIFHYLTEKTTGLYGNQIAVSHYDKNINPDILWIADKNGIEKFSIKQKRVIENIPRKRFTKEFPRLFFSNICYYNQREIFISTSKGLYLYDISNGKLTPFFNPSLQSFLATLQVNHILKSNGEFLWLGTNNGLIKYNILDKKYFLFTSEFCDSNSHINEMVYDYDNEKNDFIWIATSVGLTRFDKRKNTFKNYHYPFELTSRGVHTLKDDKRGNLWLGCYNGLARFNKKNESFYIFNEEDGLEKNEKYISSLKTNKNVFYFGSLKGITYFNVDDVKLNSATPQIFLTNFQLFNKDVKLNEVINDEVKLKTSLEKLTELDLSYEDYIIGFEFSSIDLHSPLKNRYAYKMEPIEKDWNFVNNRRYANYNLTPGDYIFHFKGSNKDQIWSSPKSVAIHISSPWYKTIWFISAILLLIAASIVEFFKYRTKLLVIKANTLAQLVDERTGELLKSSVQLESANYELEISNNELGRINSQLEKANTSLEFANKELESFSYSVSHDLKAPLRSIKGFSQILKEDFSLILPTEGVQYLDKIINSTSRMAELIEELLKLAKLSGFEITLRDVNLSEIVEEIFRAYLFENKVKNVEYKIEKDLFAKCDVTLTTTLLENLVSNALKYSSKTEVAVIEFGSTSNFDRSKCNCEKVFFVKDNGVGFDMTNYDKLFKILTRLHTNEEFEGTGIGLANVAKIIHKHGGTIWAESEINKGATFFFSLGN